MSVCVCACVCVCVYGIVLPRIAFCKWPRRFQLPSRFALRTTTTTWLAVSSGGGGKRFLAVFEFRRAHVFPRQPKRRKIISGRAALRRRNACASLGRQPAAHARRAGVPSLSFAGAPRVEKLFLVLQAFEASFQEKVVCRAGSGLFPSHASELGRLAALAIGLAKPPISTAEGVCTAMASDTAAASIVRDRQQLADLQPPPVMVRSSGA